MKLFKVERTDSVGYDEFDALVVRAESEASAIAMATGEDEYGVHFTGIAPHNIKVTEVTVAGDPEVIVSSFCAG